MKLPDEELCFPPTIVQMEKQAKWTHVDRNPAIPAVVWLIAAIYGGSLIFGARAATRLLS